MNKYFKKSEFACKCGCGFDSVDEKLARLLEKAREEAGVPFIINSGCRCESHNASVGGSKQSSHLKGMAADVSIANNAGIILKSLIKNFERIGVGRTFVHVDVDPDKKTPALWYY